MVKGVIWSPLAIKRRREILEYWIKRNGSKTYSRKLNALFKGAQKLISLHPNIGVPTNHPKVRYKLVRNYSLFYQLEEDSIIILTVWDHRQDPERLTLNE
jgi:plasmid stabilization system protein ParE